MALHFDASAATTHTAQAELERLLYTNVPKVAGGQDLRCDFTTFHLHFVKDMVLGSWDSRLRPAGKLVELRDVDGEALVGEDVDDMLLGWARDHGVRLITNEGYGQDGTVSDDDETKLRWKCVNAGVPVFTPGQFVATQEFDEERAVRSYLDRFRKAAPAFLQARFDEYGPDKGGEVLAFVEGYYRMVLLRDFAPAGTSSGSPPALASR